jgi:hypothetical protein
MKKISILFVIIFLFISCRKNYEEISNTPLNLITIPGWPIIDFKIDYTIQVPTGFVGAGLEGFEGKSFTKSSADNTIQLNGGYSNSLSILDFGDTLPNPVPASIQVVNNSAQLITLDHIENFYQDSQTIGVLFYSNAGISRGRLYWKDDNVFKQALEIDFNLSELNTLNKIIQSIKRK